MRSLAFVLLLTFSGLSQAALIDRGDGFIYDDVLDITWAQNTNINGIDTWANQTAWVEGYSQTHSVYGTFDDWRLPTTQQPDPSCSWQWDPGNGFPVQGRAHDCTGSEMGHLFNVDGISTASPGLFTNLQSNNYYWSSTEFAPSTDFVWSFSFLNGYQGPSAQVEDVLDPSTGEVLFTQDVQRYALAVRDGDIGPAGPATWYLKGVQVENQSCAGPCYGSSLDGSFVYDASTNTFSDIHIIAPSWYEISPVFTGENLTYYGLHELWYGVPPINPEYYAEFPLSNETSTTVSLADSQIGFGTLYGAELDLIFASALTNLGGTVALASGTSNIDYYNEHIGEDFTVTGGVVTTTIPVGIDVDPWSTDNYVEPNSNNTIFLAVLGSSTASGDAIDFDVSEIDAASLKLGVGEAENVALSPLYGNYDSDSVTDVAFAFKTQDTGILCEYTEVTLQGETVGGDAFEGTDIINTIDCETGGCHP